MADIQINFSLKTDNAGATKAQLDQIKAVALEIIGGKVEGYAKDLAPVGTPESTGIAGYLGGSLRDSIRHDVEGDSVNIRAGGVDGIYRTVDYAGYVELGTYKMQAQPYLTPAVEDHMDEYEQILANELSKIGK